MTKLEFLNELLTEFANRFDDFKDIANVIGMMHEAGDSNISFSAHNLGINVTANAIDIVDIYEGKSIATIELKFKED